jgi:hypothetical protein
LPSSSLSPKTKQAYGTPFGAPKLQAFLSGNLTEDDKQFAACLAAPPEPDAISALTPTFSLQRMASIGALQRSPQRLCLTVQPSLVMPMRAAQAFGGAMVQRPQAPSAPTLQSALPALGTRPHRCGCRAAFSTRLQRASPCQRRRLGAHCWGAGVLPACTTVYLICTIIHSHISVVTLCKFNTH